MDPAPLDYATNRRPRYVPTAEDRAWRFKRWVYYLAHLGALILICCGLGPNLILFHAPWGPSPAEYAHIAQQYAQLIAGIKAYQRDFGALPFSSYEMPSAYRPRNYRGPEGEILGTTSITLPEGHAVFEYEFSPAVEGWKVHAPRYDGPLPGPIVAAMSPATTQAAATQASHGG